MFLVSAARTAEVSTSARTTMLILRVAADVGFINLNDAEQLAEMNVLKRKASLVAHQVRSLV